MAKSTKNVKKPLYIMLVILVVLLGAIWYFKSQADQAKIDSQKAAQEKLDQIRQAEGEQVQSEGTGL